MDAYTMAFIDGKVVITHSTDIVDEYDINHLQELRSKVIAESDNCTEDLSFIDSLIEQAEQSIVIPK